MHSKRSSSNNLQHREDAEREHQGETTKTSWQPKLTAAARLICVHKLGDTGHDIPRDEEIKETLNWLDRYLGPVK
jgi:hypothetical protein